MSPFIGVSCLWMPVHVSQLLSLCGGDEEIRTLDPLLAGQVLSQLSYTPVAIPSFFRVLFTDPENRTTNSVTYSAFSRTRFFSSVLCEMDCLCFSFELSRVIPHCDVSP